MAYGKADNKKVFELRRIFDETRKKTKSSITMITFIYFKIVHRDDDKKNKNQCNY